MHAGVEEDGRIRTMPVLRTIAPIAASGDSFEVPTARRAVMCEEDRRRGGHTSRREMQRALAFGFPPPMSGASSRAVGSLSQAAGAGGGFHPTVMLKG
ncbi:hypothetical protein DYI37_11085 [Fulvimarina endophytica]|uniref:Uncharacterized protein n=1 Tax=Fulvimarina endophytica TaxID=2293836 RepID=A0A371X2W5_9HYPH|nr:hypothetical protein DYI37_11085 [Fulvimarina endophytica]